MVVKKAKSRAPGKRARPKAKAKARTRKAAPKHRYVVVPNQTAFSQSLDASSASLLGRMSRAYSPAGARMLTLAQSKRTPVAAHLNIVDSVAPNDTVVVEMTEAERMQLRTAFPGLRVEPETYAVRARQDWRGKLSPPVSRASGRTRTLEILVADAATGDPLKGIEVVVITNIATNEGYAGLRTDRDGLATCTLPVSIGVIERVLAMPATTYWPMMAQNVRLQNRTKPLQIDLPAINLSVADARHSLLHPFSLQAGAGVRIAIVDGGAGPHPLLDVKAGFNMVHGANIAQWEDDGSGHGTHVAGVIGAKGPSFVGLAPAAELYVYRVFAGPTSSAASADIAKAVRHATDAGCDLINLSLGASVDMPAVLREINRAQSMGAVCIVAAGNDDMSTVSYPARYPNSVAVSACGNRAAYPQMATQEGTVAAAPAPVNDLFFASFSNIGHEIDVTAPGVGIVSTMPKGKFGVMDGTSMACPIVTGHTARLLARKPSILNAPRDVSRAREITKLVLGCAVPVAFGSIYEGVGLIR